MGGKQTLSVTVLLLHYLENDLHLYVRKALKNEWNSDEEQHYEAKEELSYSYCAPRVETIARLGKPSFKKM